MLYDPGVGLCGHVIDVNERIRWRLKDHHAVEGDVLVVEQIASYGMAVGAEVFLTCFESGRFVEAWGRDFAMLTRLAVKLHLTGQPRAKDANVRQALVDRFGGPAALKKGGPLYKVAGDSWQALGVACTWADRLPLEKPSA